MRQLFSLTVVVLAGLLVGGCIVRPAANTTIHLEAGQGDDRQEITHGLADAGWIKTRDGVVLVAAGWHPREHETYAFFACEPSYGPLNRFLIIRPARGGAGGPYELVLLADAHALPASVRLPASDLPDRLVRLEARVPAPQRDFWGHYVLDLDNVALHRQGDASTTVNLSGRVLAKRTDDWPVRTLNGLALSALTHEMDQAFRKDPRAEDVQVVLGSAATPEGGILPTFYDIRVVQAEGVQETQREIIRQFLDGFGLTTRPVDAKYNQFNEDRLKGILEVPQAKVVLPGDNLPLYPLP